MNNVQKNRIKLAWTIGTARNAMRNGDYALAAHWLTRVQLTAPTPEKRLRYQRAIMRCGMATTVNKPERALLRY